MTHLNDLSISQNEHQKKNKKRRSSNRRRLRSYEFNKEIHTEYAVYNVVKKGKCGHDVGTSAAVS